MYIITGKYKNRKILGAESIRSTKSIVRSAMFNIIGPEIMHAPIIDLFGGTGILAIEALSRGAKCAIINDLSRKHLGIAKKNVENICVDERIKFMNSKAQTLKVPSYNQINIIFSDPPYEQIGITLEVIRHIKANKGSLKKILFVAECEKQEMDLIHDSYPEGEVRNYGKSFLKIFYI